MNTHICTYSVLHQIRLTFVKQKNEHMKKLKAEAATKRMVGSCKLYDKLLHFSNLPLS
jgi:hypothetical protein